MPRRGEYADIEGLPEPQHAFAEAVRTMCATIGDLPLQKIGETCHISKPVLSALLNGKQRRPAPKTLKALHDHAAECAEQQGLPLLTWEELEKLRAEVVGARPARTAYPCASCPAAPGPLPAPPALPTVAAASVSAARDVLPVPLAEGDRQHIELTAAAWPDLHDLAEYFSAGRTQDAAGLLRHIGSTAAPKEAAAAIASCQVHGGLPEAVNGLIEYAARRESREVMTIAKALLDYQMHAVAGILLELALRT